MSSDQKTGLEIIWRLICHWLQFLLGDFFFSPSLLITSNHSMVFFYSHLPLLIGHLYAHILSFLLLWPPPEVIVVFRVRQELQSLRPPRQYCSHYTPACLAQSPQTALEKNQPFLAATNPASSLLTEKLNDGKRNQLPSGAYFFFALHS